MAVELRVLGPVELRVDGRPVEIGHARQRCVLAVLLMEANRVVTMEQLLDRVWADRLPYKARQVASNYVSRLRQVLPGDVAIARHGGGYVLQVDPEAVDVHRFHHLVRQARGQDDAQALASLEEAARLWRGEAFEGLDSPWIATVREGLAPGTVRRGRRPCGPGARAGQTRGPVRGADRASASPSAGRTGHRAADARAVPQRPPSRGTPEVRPHPRTPGRRGGCRSRPGAA
ncbi:hypothetical protein GCM10022267_39310 [Lentzea roselyniae]|uniref:OmpR/PhoB-type domain-containing protein n=1 Tax=Lentzea roselyniae TaxID=531940 RepID=A0ABP7B6F3_9PSEU